MKKTREQKIEKLEKKLAKLKMSKVNYKPILDSLCYSIPMPTFYSVSDSFLGKETPKIKLIPKVNRSFNPSNVYPGNLYQAFATPKLEVGKWYKNTKMDYLFNFTKVNDEILKGYGFSSYGYGVDTWTNPNYARMNWRLATDKEVETALISEAKKRGFKEGVKFIHNIYSHPLLKNEKPNKITSNQFNYDRNNLGLDGWEIFKDGKWAETIEDTKPKINGYEMEVLKGCNGGDVIKFGCQKFDAKNVIDFYKYAEKLNLNSFSFGQYNVEIYELKEVVDYLNK